MNKSGVESYNLRRNVVDRLMTYLLELSQEEAFALRHSVSPF